MLAQPVRQEVVGQIVRTAGGDPVSGANVILVGTLYGTVTDEAGVFSLGFVPAGRYQLRVVMSGLALVEQPLDIPADLAAPLVISLRAARSPLSVEPSSVAAELFEAMVAVPSRGDPYLAQEGTGLQRVAGVGVRRYSSAYSHPVVRGLSDGRTEDHTMRLPSGILTVPGVGRIDLVSAAPSQLRGSVMLDPVSTFPATSVGFSRDRRTPAKEWALGGSAVIDLGYQTNINALRSGIQVASRGSRVQTLASGNLASGQDFSSGSGASYDSAFRHGGAFVGSTVALSGRSELSASARLVRVGYAELPGGHLDLSSADYTGGSLGWTSIPEGQRIRRAHVSVGWSQSGAELSDRSTGRVASDWISMDADTRHFQALATADIQAAGFDQLQAGVAMSATSYDWVGSPADSSAGGVVSELRLESERLQLSPFVAGRIHRGKVDLSLAGRATIFRTRTGEMRADPLESSVRRIRPAVAANLTVQANRRWRLSATISVQSIEPSAIALSPVALPGVEGLPFAAVSGRLDLSGERLTFLGMRLVRETDRQSVTFRSFVFDSRGYITARIDSAVGGFVLANTDARIGGVEVAVVREVLPFVTASGTFALAWGQNRTLKEPLPLIFPLNGRLNLEASAARGRILLELSSEFAARQNRVATSLNEPTSNAYVAFHVWLGLPLSKSFGLRTGIFNLFDASYAPHGHVYIEDQGVRLAAPGRSWLVAAQFRY